jgi:hypothetical protein
LSLSFSLIIKIPLREGAACLPNCETVAFDETTGDTPECKTVNDEFLQRNDAKNIHKQCISPFVENINNLMKNKYSFQMIYDSLRHKKNKHGLNSYFTLDASYVSIQDLMDRMSDNLPLLKQNAKFNENYLFEYYITAYKNDREIPSSDIKQVYDNYISSIEKNLNDISNRCDNYYIDESFNNIIKRTKENPSYYGVESSFHKLRIYINQGAEGKLETNP